MGDFFDKKREWSKYKDFILGYYLTPYISKLHKLNRPIIIIDCFAGRGEFRDGEPGSPLIIARAVKPWHDKGVPIRCLFIEDDPKNYEHLSTIMVDYRGFCETRLGSFDDQLDQIARLAQSNSLFLYIDPYTIRGLIFDRISAVYDQIHKARSSVEVLINFNAATFMRWALAALQRHQDIPVSTAEELVDQLEDASSGALELDILDSIAGGDYWKAIALRPDRSFTEKLQRFTRLYQEQMTKFFNYIVNYPIKEKYHHSVPKYYLIFATRHGDGLELINDAMCKARLQFLGKQFNQNMLFDLIPEREVANLSELRRTLLSISPSDGSISRKALRQKGLLKHFGRFEKKDFDAAIAALIESGELYSSTGKARINDGVLLSAIPFKPSG
ncbi:MAG: hypothetical protein JWN86_1916 [Planctomycetota bacterium]|nr:hypothetical protein [Planctomycetota bacterium]